MSDVQLGIRTYLVFTKVDDETVELERIVFDDGQEDGDGTV